MSLLHVVNGRSVQRGWAVVRRPGTRRPRGHDGAADFRLRCNERKRQLVARRLPVGDSWSPHRPHVNQQSRHPCAGPSTSMGRSSGWPVPGAVTASVRADPQRGRPDGGRRGTGRGAVQAERSSQPAVDVVPSRDSRGSSERDGSEAGCLCIDHGAGADRASSNAELDDGADAVGRRCDGCGQHEGVPSADRSRRDRDLEQVRTDLQRQPGRADLLVAPALTGLVRREVRDVGGDPPRTGSCCRASAPSSRVTVTVTSSPFVPETAKAGVGRAVVTTSATATAAAAAAAAAGTYQRRGPRDRSCELDTGRAEAD